MPETLELDDPIKHVVLLLLENHSFDQMLGCFNERYPDLDGVDKARYNADKSGRRFFQTPNPERQTTPDPRHEVEDVRAQLENNNGGFVIDLQNSFRNLSESELQQVMGYYPLGSLPALHALGEDFTICDRWFSSLPGPTWPNRFFALSGSSCGKVKMPEGIGHPDLKGFFNQDQDTIFDFLYAAQKRWWIYYYDFPCSLIFTHQRLPHHLEHYRGIDYFFNEDSRDESRFPDFAFIEPKYSGVDQNDDHPPHNVMKAEKLVADVYNAIRSNEELWKTTLLIVAFDEHGGFYDHVPPPAPEPRPPQPGDEFVFDRYGVRIPALLISPWVSRGVEHTLFDHCSVLKYLVDKWRLGEDSLGNRVKVANSIAVAIREPNFRNDTVSFIRVPYSALVPTRPDLEKENNGSHQGALHALAFFLAQEFDGLAAEAVAAIAAECKIVDRLKAKVGKAFLKAGAWLSKGAEQQLQEQARHIKKAIENAVGHL